MNRYELSESAEDDLLSIFVYTLKKWGVAQADFYQDQITSAFERISNDPFLIGSQARGQYAQGCRVFKTGKHFIVYLANESPIGIVRILHESMDHPNQLKEQDFQ